MHKQTNNVCSRIVHAPRCSPKIIQPWDLHECIIQTLDWFKVCERKCLAATARVCQYVYTSHVHYAVCAVYLFGPWEVAQWSLNCSDSMYKTTSDQPGNLLTNTSLITGLFFFFFFFNFLTAATSWVGIKNWKCTRKKREASFYSYLIRVIKSRWNPGNNILLGKTLLET